MSAEQILVPMTMSVNTAVLPTEMSITMPEGSDSKYYRLWNRILTKTMVELTDDMLPENLLTINDYLFQNNPYLSLIDLSMVQHVGTDTFSDCGITEINMPSLIDANTGSFRANPLTEVSLPALTSVSNGMFAGCRYLERAEFQTAGTLRANCFSGCLSLAKLVLRNAQMVFLEGRRHFEYTPIEDGTGLIYVPEDLISEYQTSPMWETYSEQFRSLSELNA